ncbi:peptidylprolyl isomerase [Methanolobus sp. WCC5]|uniref:FKBP-type peptidyl-prolyl cis-trans isomerase n=1 Tax=Methanolobus sp. WCC5 TaxID=3125785 RepID=UPI0032540939
MKKKLLLLLLLLCVLFVSGCVGSDSPDTVQVGDHVSVNYIGSLDDGTVFDTSIEEVAISEGIYNPGRNYEPLPFTVGAGQMIKGFDDAVIGMSVGENRTVILLPQEAYGEVSEDYIITYSMDDFTSVNITPVIGEKITSQGHAGTIINVSEDMVIVDFNHHLAGKNLTFFIELVSIDRS